MLHRPIVLGLCPSRYILAMRLSLCRPLSPFSNMVKWSIEKLAIRILCRLDNPYGSSGQSRVLIIGPSGACAIQRSFRSRAVHIPVGRFGTGSPTLRNDRRQPRKPSAGTVWGRRQSRDERVRVNSVSVDLVKTERLNVFIRADTLSPNIFIDGRGWAGSARSQRGLQID